ncbi:hypothetical protein D7Y15_24745, partial [Corallococcus sp. AB030]
VVGLEAVDGMEGVERPAERMAMTCLFSGRGVRVAFSDEDTHSSGHANAPDPSVHAQVVDLAGSA